MDIVVECLMRNTKDKLLFCWVGDLLIAGKKLSHFYWTLINLIDWVTYAFMLLVLMFLSLFSFIFLSH